MYSIGRATSTTEVLQENSKLTTITIYHLQCWKTRSSLHKSYHLFRIKYTPLSIALSARYYKKSISYKVLTLISEIHQTSPPTSFFLRSIFAILILYCFPHTFILPLEQGKPLNSSAAVSRARYLLCIYLNFPDIKLYSLNKKETKPLYTDFITLFFSPICE